VFLIPASRFDFFILIFLNYIVASVSLFIFFNLVSGSNKFIGAVRGGLNPVYSWVLFILPLLSLAGAAPSLGFLIKFLLVLAGYSLDQIIVFSVLAAVILFSMVFYFQFFKNFFSKTAGGVVGVPQRSLDPVSQQAVSLTALVAGVAILFVYLVFFYGTLFFIGDL
jgi:formate hydrogenlyase subunit 3/multisubunit Na+/H+ antiporter MnhD subunit